MSKVTIYMEMEGPLLSAALAKGVLYVGSDDHSVYALNASTGAVRWSTPTGGAVRSSPAVVNGVVYGGSNDTNLYALDASTGAILWSTVLSGFNPVESSPSRTAWRTRPMTWAWFTP